MSPPWAGRGPWWPGARAGAIRVVPPAMVARRHGGGDAMRPISALILGVALVAALPALAQDYPNRSVTIVAPSAPGGMYSILARLIASKLEARYGKSFVVENRPGASSVTGSVAVVR